VTRGAPGEKSVFKWLMEMMAFPHVNLDAIRDRAARASKNAMEESSAAARDVASAADKL
jgi:hypothetical protein